MVGMAGCEMQPTKIEKDDRVSVNDANYEAAVEQSSKPVVMEFHAEWCGPCRAMEPTVAALSVEMPEVVFAKIDVDEAVQLAVKYQVTSIPCFIFFKDGRVVGRSNGSLSKSDLESLITGLLK
jgi:thioredoxin 1